MPPSDAPPSGATSHTPFPPSELIGRVGVEQSLAGDAQLAFFDESGRRSRQDIVSALPAGWAWAGKSVLDFGCGSGRVLRHFTEAAGSCDFWACDIDERSIDWIDEQLAPPFKPYVCAEQPPLPHESGSLDLIYAVSVFSHLAPNWAEWACELQRVLRTGGLLIVSILGRGDWPDGVAGQRGVPFEEERIGMHVEHFGSRFEDSWGPAVYVSEWWFREHWGRAFDVLRYCPHGFAGTSEDKRAGAGQAWAVLTPNKTKRPTPAELSRSRHEDSRELEAALHSRNLAYAEMADLRSGELRRLNRDWYAHQARISALEKELARADPRLDERESSIRGHARALANRLRRHARRQPAAVKSDVTAPSSGGMK